ncbi:hypothetical protein MMC13_003639 [Lambiella insularis]|nr:hypothetical protein [Lambiella insularis]
MDKSPLALLPPELRNRIYGCLFPRGLVYSIPDEDEKPLKCQSHCLKPEGECFHFAHYYHEGLSRDRAHGKGHGSNDNGIAICLLATCKQVYKECIGLAYGNPTFVFFRYPFHMATPWSFFTLIGPLAASQVQNLSIRFRDVPEAKDQMEKLESFNSSAWLRCHKLKSLYLSYYMVGSCLYERDDPQERQLYERAREWVANLIVQNQVECLIETTYVEFMIDEVADFVTDRVFERAGYLRCFLDNTNLENTELVSQYLDPRLEGTADRQQAQVIKDCLGYELLQKNVYLSPHGTKTQFTVKRAGSSDGEPSTDYEYSEDEESSDDDESSEEDSSRGDDEPSTEDASCEEDSSDSHQS